MAINRPPPINPEYPRKSLRLISSTTLPPRVLPELPPGPLPVLRDDENNRHHGGLGSPIEPVVNAASRNDDIAGLSMDLLLVEARPHSLRS
jgi:hypothetical protein